MKIFLVYIMAGVLALSGGRESTYEAEGIKTEETSETIVQSRSSKKRKKRSKSSGNITSESAEPSESPELSESPESSEPAEPAEQSEPAEPVEPVEPAESVEPSEPAEPVEPSEPAEPSEPSEPSEPAEPSEPSEPAEPSVPAEPSESPEPLESAEPSVSPEPSKPTESAESPEPSESPKSPEELALQAINKAEKEEIINLLLEHQYILDISMGVYDKLEQLPIDNAALKNYGVDLREMLVEDIIQARDKGFDSFETYKEACNDILEKYEVKSPAIQAKLIPTLPFSFKTENTATGAAIKVLIPKDYIEDGYYIKNSDAYSIINMIGQASFDLKVDHAKGIYYIFNDKALSTTSEFSSYTFEKLFIKLGTYDSAKKTYKVPSDYTVFYVVLTEDGDANKKLLNLYRVDIEFIFV